MICQTVELLEVSYFLNLELSRKIIEPHLDISHSGFRSTSSCELPCICCLLAMRERRGEHGTEKLTG
jgi:hypothetical protein